MIPDAPLRRTTGCIVLDAIPGKHLYVAVVHPNRHADDQRALRQFEALAQVGVQAHRFRRFIKLGDGEAEGMGIEFNHRDAP